MNNIINITSINEVSFNKEQWTAIIPAAGRGSRLGYDKPKIIFPLLDRPIVDWLIDALSPVCSHFIFVLSPEGRPDVEPYLSVKLDTSLTIVEQRLPTGMGDAVLLCEKYVNTPYTMVLWGDQVAIRSETIEACATMHELRTNATLTFPTVVKRNPYIHFERENNGKLVAVKQAREKSIDNEYGENDCGLFLFSTASLFPILVDARKKNIGLGLTTGEFNLLQVLPEFERGYNSVMTVRIENESEALGINTLDDAHFAESVLLKRLYSI